MTGQWCHRGHAGQLNSTFWAFAQDPEAQDCGCRLSIPKPHKPPVAAHTPQGSAGPVNNPSPQKETLKQQKPIAVCGGRKGNLTSEGNGPGVGAEPGAREEGGSDKGPLCRRRGLLARSLSPSQPPWAPELGVCGGGGGGRLYPAGRSGHRPPRPPSWGWLGPWVSAQGWVWDSQRPRCWVLMALVQLSTDSPKAPRAQRPPRRTGTIYRAV